MKSPVKSKTLQLNVLIPAIWGIVKAMGIDVPDEAVIGTLSIVNFILRFFTSEPIK